MITNVNFICLSAIDSNYRETPKWQTWPFMHCTITTTVTVIILNPSFYFCFISFLFMPTKRQCASLKYFSVQYCKQKKEMHFLFDIWICVQYCIPIFQTASYVSNLLYLIKLFTFFVKAGSICNFHIVTFLPKENIFN